MAVTQTGARDQVVVPAPRVSPELQLALRAAVGGWHDPGELARRRAARVRALLHVWLAVVAALVLVLDAALLAAA